MLRLLPQMFTFFPIRSDRWIGVARGSSETGHVTANPCLCPHQLVMPGFTSRGPPRANRENTFSKLRPAARPAWDYARMYGSRVDGVSGLGSIRPTFIRLVFDTKAECFSLGTFRFL